MHRCCSAASGATNTSESQLIEPAYRDPRFDEPVESLSNNIRARKKFSKFLPRQKADLLHEPPRSDGVGTRPSPPASPSPEDGYARREWKPLPADEVKVRLYREPIIRRLYPKRLSDTLNFRSEERRVGKEGRFRGESYR